MTDTLPALRALDKAAKLAGWKSWRSVKVFPNQNEIIAFARYIEDPEPEPVDRFLVMAREVLALQNDSNAHPMTAKQCRAGDYDHFLKSAADYLREQWEKRDVD